MSASSTAPLSAPKQPKASPEKSTPSARSSVIMVSGQCTMGVR